MHTDNMENKSKRLDFEWLLIGTALILTAVIIIFIAVDSPPLTSERVVSPAGISETATASSSTVAQTSQDKPSAVAAQTESQTETASEFQEGLININKADEQTLTELPGIGEVIAKRIVEYREENGDFASVDELTSVNGIGDKKLEQLREFATVD